MIILQETVNIQEIKIIPKLEGIIDLITLRNETTNETIGYVVASYDDRFFVLIQNVFDLKENHFYELKAFADVELVHRDRIFCTNQNVNTFSVNKDEYITPNTNNSIIFYE